MPKKKRKARKKKRSSGDGGSKGSLSGMRGGIKGLVGQGGARKKESLLGQAVTYLLILAVIAVVIYRFATCGP